ncbi:MAG: DUF2089 domain-containing protein [Candidatus Brocadiia bacterium]
MDHAEVTCPQCGRRMEIVRYACPHCDVTVEGHFELPPLARLSLQEQAFVTAFVRVHGNIKRMEELFDISYPTVKKRLNDIGAKLDEPFRGPDEPGTVLARLERGEITVEEALDMLEEA